METKVFNVMDNLYKALPRKDLPCYNPDTGTLEPSYQGGIGGCIDSKHCHCILICNNNQIMSENVNYM